MNGGWRTVFPALVLAGAVAVAAVGEAADFGLVPPVRLAECRVYEDGGTIGFALVDAGADTLLGGRDGRARPVDAEPAPLWYVGSFYPAQPRVRFLPPGSREERSLLNLLSTVLQDSLGAERMRHLTSIRRAQDLPDGVSLELWSLAGAVAGDTR